MGPTTELRRAVKAMVLPHAAARGFTIDQRLAPASITFRRRAGGAVHIFEMQWDTYGRPRFRVHFGTCPGDGLRVNGVTHSPDDTLATWCPDRGSLQPGRGAHRGLWFRQDATLVQRLLGSPRLRDPADVVGGFLALFPSLERYWTDGEVGPHLRQWDG